jgi:hypothetical protein
MIGRDYDVFTVGRLKRLVSCANQIAQSCFVSLLSIPFLLLALCGLQGIHKEKFDLAEGSSSFVVDNNNKYV